MTPQLFVVSGPDEHTSFKLLPGVGHFLGRSSKAAYQVTDPRVSRIHCEIRWQDGEITVLDRGSKAGTKFNGKRMAQRVLRLGDKFQVGDTVLHFVYPDGIDDDDVPAETGKAEKRRSLPRELGNLSGHVLSHYMIRDSIGKGKSSMVFRATDSRNGKEIALKVMEPGFSSDDASRQRFLRTIRTALPLRHPNLVRLFSAGKQGECCWMAMELVKGESVRELIRKIGVAGMLDWRVTYRICLDIARALAYAHDKKILHRNVTPTNILVAAKDRTAKLADLVLVKAMEGTLAEQITQPGEILGETQFLSPEATYGAAGRIDSRSDLFSLGATIYTLLTGKGPFGTPVVAETLQRIRMHEPEKPRKVNMSIPAMFETVALRMLAKAPEERFQTAHEVVEELERVGRCYAL